MLSLLSSELQRRGGLLGVATTHRGKEERSLGWFSSLNTDTHTPITSSLRKRNKGRKKVRAEKKGEREEKKKQKKTKVEGRRRRNSRCEKKTKKGDTVEKGTAEQEEEGGDNLGHHL